MRLLKEEAINQDDRRTIKQLFTANIRQVNYYEAKKGSTLGNHYHKHTDEYFYIIHGLVLYNDARVISKDEFFVVNPEETHTLHCLTNVKFMTFLTKPYTKEDPDTWINQN